MKIFHLSLPFALYLNDLQEFLSHAYNGLQTVSDLVQEQTETADTITYLISFLLFYMLMIQLFWLNQFLNCRQH